MLSAETPEDPLASPVGSDSGSEKADHSDSEVEATGVFDDSIFSSNSETSSEGPQTRTCNPTDVPSSYTVPPRKVFNTHSPEKLTPTLSKATSKGGEKGKGGKRGGVFKPFLKGKESLNRGNEIKKTAQEQRVENLRNYTKARLIWEKLVNWERCVKGDAEDPCKGESTEVVKMVKLGGTYLDDFVKYDGHRKAMAAWRSKTKAEKKQGKADAKGSVTHEYARAMEKYREQWCKLHGSAGSSVLRKSTINTVMERVSRVSKSSRSATTKSSRGKCKTIPMVGDPCIKPGFTLHGLTGSGVRRGTVRDQSNKSVSRAVSSCGTKKSDSRNLRRSRENLDVASASQSVSRAPSSKKISQIAMPEKALSYRPKRASSQSSTPGFKFTRRHAAPSRNSSKRSPDDKRK